MSLHWSERYGVGDAVIDAQHKRLFELIGELRVAVEARSKPEGLLGIVETLERYVAVHFHYEEQMLARSGYSDLEAHVQHHRRFARELSERASRLRGGDPAQAASLLRWLMDWWDSHVLVKDRRYSEELGLKRGGPDAP